MKKRAVPSDLPARPAEEAVRRLALAELERAREARDRLVSGDRDEALHDFRVALRRLRSLIRAHRGEFSLDYPKKLVRRISALAAATNPGRDAEVQLAWLETLVPDLKPVERAGHRELSRQIEERRDESYRKVEREIVRDFGELADGLVEALASYRVAVRLDRGAPAPSFALATRAALLAERDELKARLAKVVTAADEKEGHQARISAKRLRYVAESVLPWAEEARTPVSRLKSLQDLLGELHDGQLLEAHVAAALAELESRQAHLLVEATVERGESEAGTGGVAGAAGAAAASARRRLRPGFLGVARALGEHRSALFADLAGRWLGESPAELEALDGEVTELAERLQAPARTWRTARRAPARTRRKVS